ncbi:MAG: 30S ribosomal protein S20 [Alphaproteobacteria bacterium]|nr:30S ribosomal protein S20 [Alphaproteobacteria bacterium]
MANSASARKRIRRNDARAVVNHARKSRIRTFIKKVELALSNSDAQGAEEAFRAAQPELMRGVSKGVFNKKTASRKLSRLSARIKAIK